MLLLKKVDVRRNFLSFSTLRSSELSPAAVFRSGVDFPVAESMLRLNFYIDGAEDVFGANHFYPDHRPCSSAAGSNLRPGLHGVARREKTLLFVGAALVSGLQSFEGKYSETDGQDCELGAVSFVLINRDENPKLAAKLTKGEKTIPQIILYTPSEDG